MNISILNILAIGFGLTISTIFQSYSHYRTISGMKIYSYLYMQIAMQNN